MKMVIQVADINPSNVSSPNEEITFIKKVRLPVRSLYFEKTKITWMNTSRNIARKQTS